MNQNSTPLSNRAFFLGLAGLLPQALCCVVALTSLKYGMYVFVSGFAYAALIFSFIGGVWWGQALATPTRHLWIFGAAICPSLIAWVAALLLFSDLKWWSYATAAIAFGLLFSPLIDRQINKVIPQPLGWLKLRWALSIGLGCLTMVLASFTVRAI